MFFFFFFFCFFYFFFFQAEDGIRDLTVTGVQTCALPIFVCDELEWHAHLTVGLDRHLLRTRALAAQRSLAVVHGQRDLCDARRALAIVDHRGDLRLVPRPEHAREHGAKDERHRDARACFGEPEAADALVLGQRSRRDRGDAERREVLGHASVHDGAAARPDLDVADEDRRRLEALACRRWAALAHARRCAASRAG